MKNVDESEFKYIAGAPPECLKSLYYLNHIFGIGGLVLVVCSFLAVIIVTGGKDECMELWVKIAAGEALVLWIGAKIRRKKLERELYQQLPTHLHLIYRYNILGRRGYYLPEILAENDVTALKASGSSQWYAVER